jgi:LacI family transcriptional regulator
VKPPSIRDVAAAARVAPGTVSHVLNHPDRVKDETKARVLAAMRDLGYARNEAARHLRAGSSRTLGMLVLDAWNPFFTEMARGVEDLTFEQDWALLLANSARRNDREAMYLSLFGERRLAGLLIVPNGPQVTEQLAALRMRGIPSVLLDQASTEPGQMSVSLDDVRGGEMALECLLDLGHRRVTFVGDPTRVAQVKNRLTGARRAWRKAGLHGGLEVLRPTDLTVEAGVAVGSQLLALAPGARPSALFAANDMLAVGILQVLLRAGIRVPDDIALVGYDDNIFARHLLVPLTTIRQPAYDMGKAAASMLTARLRGEPVEQPHLQFKPVLVVRESTAVRTSP